MPILYTLFFLCVPAGMLYLAHHQLWAQKLGVILLCYLAGLLVGNAGLMPEAAGGVQLAVSEITVALALPMLLFTVDIRQWSKMAGKALLSMLFATTSVVTLATVWFYLSRENGVEASSHLAAMSVGLYTGGTPNLAAIKTALEIPHSQYIIFHSLDTLIGGAYLLFMLTVGIPVSRWFLGKPQKQDSIEAIQAQAFDEENYTPLFRRENLPQVLQILVLGALVLTISLVLSELTNMFFPARSTSALTIILLTTLGMALSFVPRVRALALSYKTGMYLIYVFCFSVATMASLNDLAAVSFSIAMFVLGTVAGSLFLHAILCKLAGIDSDTFVVTSVSAICSPPFVPMIVKALGNPGVLLSGMTTGIIGYALGNYLGISLALFLQA
ncbi:MAG: DUF819 family protein [Halioglobus sp.]|nr:DUF819 family protein [Halioglobus sp.]